MVLQYAYAAPSSSSCRLHATTTGKRAGRSSQLIARVIGPLAYQAAQRVSRCTALPALAGLHADMCCDRWEAPGVDSLLGMLLLADWQPGRRAVMPTAAVETYWVIKNHATKGVMAALMAATTTCGLTTPCATRWRSTQSAALYSHRPGAVRARNLQAWHGMTWHTGVSASLW